MASNSHSSRPVTKSFQEYARGVTGGLIFSLPLLYTMEMWWTGFLASPERLMLAVVATFILLLGYNRYAGMRPGASFGEVVIDSVEELGLGLVLSALVLFLLGRLTSEMSLNEIVGRIVIEAISVAIGISVGTAQLGGGDEEDENAEEEEETERENPGFLGQLAITFCGAVLFGCNVAPTEEIVVIGLEASSLRLLGVAFFSLALSALILYGIDFRGAQRFSASNGRFPVLRGAVVSYGVALVVSAAILWFFGRFEGNALLPALKQTVALALPGALGASGGRLLLQTP